MSMLDQIGALVGSTLGQGGKGGTSGVLVQRLIAMLSKPGALNNLMNGFQGAGLGNAAQSWVSTGENLPISGDQVRRVLGSGTISDLAKSAGVRESDASDALAGLLPQVIDKLSPNGKLPSQGDLGGALASLGKLFH